MSVRPMPGSMPRTGLPEWKPYVYRGTGRDELTAHLTPYETVTAAPPSAYETGRDALLALMCAPCWDDDCPACQAGTCKCACRDEPAPDPRCETCGYLVRGQNHKIMCGEP